jgi:hypothetical protein
MAGLAAGHYLLSWHPDPGPDGETYRPIYVITDAGRRYLTDLPSRLLDPTDVVVVEWSTSVTERYRAEIVAGELEDMFGWGNGVLRTLGNGELVAPEVGYTVPGHLESEVFNFLDNDLPEREAADILTTREVRGRRVCRVRVINPDDVTAATPA